MTEQLYKDKQYRTQSGEDIITWYAYGRYFVACYFSEECRWLLEFDNETEATKEFERWRK